LPDARSGVQRTSIVTVGSPTRLLGPALLAAVIVATTAAPAIADDRKGRTDGSRGVIHGSLRPGDLFFDRGVGVVVPPRGQTVWAELKLEDGTAQTLQVETGRRGVVRLFQLGDELAGRDGGADHGSSGAGSAFAGLGLAGLGAVSGAAASDADAGGGGKRQECRERANNRYGWRTPHYAWRYAASTTPAKFRARDGGRKQVVKAIARATRNITRAHNLCGRRDRISLTIRYKGTTDRRPDVHPRGYCARADRRNVIGFGDLPSRSIAFACVYTLGGRRTIDGDVTINRDKAWETRRARCSGRELLVESAITHELGHVFGLAHVNARSRSLTMHPLFHSCSLSHASLGLGDMLGLERKY
jgi:hypothetical protein